MKKIMESEGYREHPYRDHLGFWTVGWGHLIHHTQLRELLPRQTLGSVMDFLTDRDNHERWLIEDVGTAIEDARRWLGFLFDDLTELRQEVITEMAFQLGYTNLAKFKKTRAFIAAEDWAEASDEMLRSKWARQTPRRANSLAYDFRIGKEPKPVV